MFRSRRRDYHDIHTRIEPKRQRKQEKSQWRLKFLNRFYLAVILGALAWLTYFLFYSSTFKIRNIRLFGNQEISEGEIMKSVNDFLASRKYLIFRRSNFFILDQEKLKKKLQNDFIFDDLEIRKGWFKDLNIRIKERLSKINLCFEEKCYLVDYEGVVTQIAEKKEINPRFPLVFYKLEEASETSTLEIWAATSTVEAALKNQPKIFLGRTKLDKETAHYILDLFMEYEKIDSGLGLESLEIYDCDYCKGKSSLLIQPKEKITINTKKGLKIYIDQKSDIGQQLNNLKILLNKKFRQADLKKLEYIDLRFGEKMYYK